mmetsp:Transcript_12789/g.32735  ORF Transcript_12789/g.32735 Transcript_12789/m.32735 type:complete len:88 (-) Transcript_12789:244-507(-)
MMPLWRWHEWGGSEGWKSRGGTQTTDDDGSNTVTWQASRHQCDGLTPCCCDVEERKAGTRGRLNMYYLSMVRPILESSVGSLGKLPR